MRPHDEDQRHFAIDPTQSFIIQAPAGSGKTELLTQRYLNLLALAVKNPEEIIAITFTRKAAAEMRERIISALHMADEMPEPTEPHKKKTWQLAQRVLEVDEKNHWKLLLNPNRLRILTIDALCAMLSVQMPLLSGFGAKPTIVDNAQPYYRKSVVELLDNPQHLQADVEILLLHFDNQAERLVTLLIQLIEKREQWLPHIIHQKNNLNTFKIELQHSLDCIVEEILQHCVNALPLHCRGELCNLAGFAAENIMTQDPKHPIAACLGLIQLPKTTSDTLAQWRGLAHLLLNQKLEWRKSIDKRNGFPVDKKIHKQRMLALLKVLEENEDIKSSFIDIIHCPPSTYTEQQWKIISALMHILPQLTAELHWQFQKNNVIDFVELSLGALRALGDADHPTEIALYLDYQIQHLLVDEFQDTSISQFNVLNRIVQEWQPGDGKTLFIVGDPMQSIYRFRNAEVGLFLQAQQQGIAHINLINLQLTKNFRSHAPIVDWVNQSFSTIFPQTPNMVRGAVPYSPSMAIKKNAQNSYVTYHATSMTDNISASEKMVERILDYQKNQPADSIAILVRSRSHLLEIIPMLNERNILFQAVELETLHHRPEIQDLLALTRALLHLGDRIAWLSLLRAPWAGIKLTDLHHICQKAQNKPLWFVLQHPSTMLSLSEDAQLRLNRIIPILAHSLHEQGRRPLSEWIKGTWLGLSGPDTLKNQTEYNNTQQFFQLIEDIQFEFSFSLLTQKLERLYAKPDYPQNVTLQLMTIHKSKGLEFDHVFLPELQKTSPSEKNSLLLWLEYPTDDGKTHLMLAPIKAHHEMLDPIHSYLKKLENKKLEFELARLLYVAVTRAKKTLHLFCKLNVDAESGEIKPPIKNTFLDLLWKNHNQTFLQYFTEHHHAKSKAQSPEKNTIRRLPNEWPFPQVTIDSNPLKKNAHPLKKNAHPLTKISIFEQHSLSILGTVIHEALQRIAQYDFIDFQKQRAFWQRRLIQLGLPQKEMPEILNQIEQAVKNTQTDARGTWIVKKHQDHHCEYPLTALVNHRCHTYFIDRTFVDENGVRWIIDYKSATPQETEMNTFLEKQKILHRQQLEGYAACFKQLENRTIKLGLYFPLCRGWIDWEYKDPSVF